MSRLVAINALQAAESEGFKAAVEEWRAEKPPVIIVEAGGGFLTSVPIVEANAAEDDEEEASDEEGVGMDLEGALSPGALAALRGHLAAKDASAAENLAGTDVPPSENYGMSQFWWDDASSEALGREALSTPSLLSAQAAGGSSGSGEGPRRVALLSAPSVWFALQRIQAQGSGAGDGGASATASAAAAAAAEVQLLEFDRRFSEAAGSNYTYYDYTCPGDIPPALRGTFDYVIAGPPYVSEECIDQYIVAFELLAKGPHTPRALVIGASLENSLAARGFAVAEDVELGYRSKFCTPMRLYRKY
jgi:hypothetical protein